ncbi:retron-type reverse transcriptase [Sulfuritortus calidifontis]|uniref:Retron-type reverse transcriptase n=1 Tax=Sulfuritortus calidifontis TaxID=1914471 RepID=A0A4R3JVJ7_9PROT|nr:reverse transcriptase/maturase family protein [Sulfuritortus calidifontis]TCS72093.1 retron-type reverse transcriptase [Sulfuritortus calidifontis]
MNGGNWDNGAYAGLFCLNVNNAPSNANSNIGARLAMDTLARSGVATAAPTAPYPSGPLSCPALPGEHEQGAAGRMLAASALFERITAWENILAAWHDARRGKRGSEEVRRLELDIEANLISLHEHLLRGTWQPGNPRRFWVRDPKWREITAPPFADRIVHHAIVRVIEPLFERRFIADSYACRKGRGTHAAVMRTQAFLRRAKRRWGGGAYVVKCDVKSYFASIQHDILMRQIERVVECQRTLALLRRVFGGYGFDGVGLPVGALTSQLAANILLDALDHRIKDDWGVREYVRYMDDFILIAPDRETARAWLDAIGDELAALGLRLNPNSGYWPLKRGVDFCGYRIWTTHIRPRQRAIRAWKRRLHALSVKWRMGAVSLARCRAAVMSMLAVMRWANASKTTAALLDRFILTKETRYAI